MSKTVNKEALYKNLCEDVKKYYTIGNKDELLWCNDCEEINLWTYWQGVGSLNPKILLVGQDWGNASKVTKAIIKKNLLYPNPPTNPTDLNLVRLFKELGYDINTKNKDLFFTNLILGYRQGNISGGYKSSWLSNEMKSYFDRLVSILEPNIILCLGQTTFKGVISSLNIDLKKYQDYKKCKNFNEKIVYTGKNPISTTKNGQDIKIFALAHCGSMGTLNRNKVNGKTNNLLDNQIKDWEKIKKFL